MQASQEVEGEPHSFPPGAESVASAESGPAFTKSLEGRVDGGHQPRAKVLRRERQKGRIRLQASSLREVSQVEKASKE